VSGISDPIADMLTRLRNASMVGHDYVLVPQSGLKLAIINIFKTEGFIKDFEIVKHSPQNVIRVALAYRGTKDPVIKGLKRISKPGLRVYVGSHRIPRSMGGLGISILSTPQGVLPDREARKRGIGGELVCQVW